MQSKAVYLAFVIRSIHTRQTAWLSPVSKPVPPSSNAFEVDWTCTTRLLQLTLSSFAVRVGGCEGYRRNHVLYQVCHALHCNLTRAAI